MTLLKGIDKAKLDLPGWTPEELRDRIQGYTPRTDLGRIVREILCGGWLPHDLAGELLHKIERHMVIESGLSVVVFRGNGALEDYGQVASKVITTAGVGFLVDAWQNAVELENLKFHGFGTGATAEDAGDTALVTELTTQYSTDNTRPTGSTTEGAAANIFRSVGTLSPDATVTIEEHGLFDQASNAGGVLWDRSLTGGQALTSTDSLEATYDMTASSGG